MSIFRTVVGRNLYFSGGKYHGLDSLYNGELRSMNFTLHGYGFRVVRRVRG